ncbi:hypothetical protein NPIL_585751 [Nephila pilipes]|uniref:Uncharacterized protein n=1 Tax=Nephila pilipes TaxID=299642 RepID=A0A8X6TIC8_NEPPI|nr:hypothetical protein NPIL_585751 [Nephila pilipes]
MYYGPRKLHNEFSWKNSCHCLERLDFCLLVRGRSFISLRPPERSIPLSPPGNEPSRVYRRKSVVTAQIRFDMEHSKCRAPSKASINRWYQQGKDMVIEENGKAPGR